MVAKCVFSSTVMLMRGGYCRLENLTHRNSQTLAALVKLKPIIKVQISGKLETSV